METPELLTDGRSITEMMQFSWVLLDFWYRP